MSRHQNQRLQQQQQQQQLQQEQMIAQQQQLMAENAAAAEAAELFDLFCVATTMRQILGLHRNMCDLVGLRPGPLNEFYPKLKVKVRSWKAQALWKKFDARAAHRVYAKGNACAGTRVLVIGAGPCGLRTAIEAQLLGAKVVVLEKRDRISRNNVLHLWPFVITDLRNLGAKKFYGKFCAGSIDHISIRQLQCMLLKVALLLGVEIHEGVSFEHEIEPNGDGLGWRAALTPEDHPVSHYEFDVLIGADGKRNMLAFRRKEFRGKLAIAITANFINKKTEAEAKVEEISGVAFIFNQSFFKELYQRTGIDLENIVYYKDETHYFVMTAKKHSLIDKGVIMEDLSDPAELLAPANVDTEKLHDYAREAAEFSTQYQMPNLEFAVNHYGKPDVAMFDFTSMFAAEMSCRVIVRKGFRLMQCLVGDSLLEPFWPTGSGCARGFLSSMDAAYAIKLWANPQNSTLGVLAQRESIYRLLGQTTPDTLQRDISAYTVDPATRYPNLNRESVNVWQVKHLVDTDDPSILEQTFIDINALQAPVVPTPERRKRRSGDTLQQGANLLRWITAQLHSHEFIKDLKEPSDVFRNGKVLCALISRYRPDLIDFDAVKDSTPIECNNLAFEILEKKLHIERIMSAKESIEMIAIDSRKWLHYLEQICEQFRGEIPHVKHPKMDFSDLRVKYRFNHAHAQPDFSKLLQTKPKQTKSPLQQQQDLVDIPTQTTTQRRSVLDDERVKRQRRHEQLMASGAAAGGVGNAPQTDTTPRRSKKRRSADKSTNIEERQQRLQEIEQNRQDRMSKRRQQRYHQTQNFYKSLQMLQVGNYLREKGDGADGDGDAPFEDYSIFLYRQQAPIFNDRVKELERKLLYPDRERSDIPSALLRSGAADEQFNDRIKNMEQRISSRGNYGTDKKPKDLMRAIGKIDSNDWNVREIEKKIEQSKKTEIHGPKGREKVPKWNREQFLARHNKMSKPQRQDSREEARFREIDQTMKNLDKQLKEGHNLDVGERGRNKVASIAGQFVKKDDQLSEETTINPLMPPVPKSGSKVALAFKKQAASEKCRFCKQTVYLMERITVEGLILHRGCLKCHHCHTNLRLGGYAFDRDDPHGRFYCTQHFRLPAKPMHRATNKGRKSTQENESSAVARSSTNVPAAQAIDTDNLNLLLPDKSIINRAGNFDLLDHSRTDAAARASSVDPISDDEGHVIDEHEWSGRNFLPESNNDSESDLSSSDESDSESESDIYEEADDSPFGAQTLQLATDWIGKQHYPDSDDSDDFYDSSEDMADDGKDDTEGEDFKKARELRREEVRLQPLPANLPTDTETEVQTDSETTSPVEVELNSATEISTDSEFDNDELIRHAPKIFIDDTHLRKPAKVQIKSSVITPSAGQHNKSAILNSKTVGGGGSYLAKYKAQPPLPQFKPLVQVDPTLLTGNRTPLQNPRPGDYLLNKTASTEGIASKKSLELKKRYLLGEPANGNKIQKSGSTSVLDSRIRSFQSNISECQKLLNPSSNISASMKTFLDCTKVGDDNNSNNELMRSATSSILNDLKVEIKIQKTPSLIDNEKENVFVSNKNELNKGMEYSETVNAAMLESINKNNAVTTPSPPDNKTVIECIDLVTPEKAESTKREEQKLSQLLLHHADSNKIIDLTTDTPTKDGIRPDLSKDVKESIPDILDHIQQDTKPTKDSKHDNDQRQLLSNSDDEKRDCPEKVDNLYESDIVQIQVPNIPWKKHKIRDQVSSTTTSGSSCSSSSNTSSIEDIQHYLLDSTTSPDTQTGGMAKKQHNVPRVEVHDAAGTLMQVDSLMIIDGRYIGDPEDLKFLDMPKGIIVDEDATMATTTTAAKTTGVTTDVDDENDIDLEPVTATPEPAECTVIEVDNSQPQTQPPPPLPDNGPPLPEKGPPILKPAHFKFDTKNENKIESLKNLPLIVEHEQSMMEHTKSAIKPVTLNLITAQKTTPDTPTTPTGATMMDAQTPNDNDKTPTADLLSKGSDSETELTGTAQVLTETELSDWTADDCISENFIDMEFVLNSNKGTIKRNKKERKKFNSSKMQSSFKALPVAAAPVVEFEGILKSIDIDDIDFMDTGSEGSCAEAYSATNTALLRNRGYMEYIETQPRQQQAQAQQKKLVATTSSSEIKQQPIEQQPQQQQQQQIKPNTITKRDEKLGIDYIEQGAYILQQDDNNDALKTPVNESPPHGVIGNRTETKSQQTQNTDSNDLDEDSFGVNSKTNNTITEESEALTIVTSPLESNSPRTGFTAGTGKDSETPSSSDKQPKTSQSTCTPSTSSTTSSSRETPLRQHSVESDTGSGEGANQNNEISYEDYVRALQQKITQISTSRDSLDSRKQRRKSSKGESPNMFTNQTPNILTVIEPKTNKQVDAQTNPTNTTSSSSQQTVTQLNKVPEVPTLSSKLEEITKERTKQKDLIHDLVMDKLQSKKQLNAEKRLHRSRQRSLLTSGYASGSSLSPTPKIAAPTTTSDTNCTNQAHYHISTAEPDSPNSERQSSSRSTSHKENNPLQKSATYVSPYRADLRSPAAKPPANIYNKQRPFSEHIDIQQLDSIGINHYKLNKTPSFTMTTDYALATPVVGSTHHQTRGGRVPDETNTNTTSISASTESLRSEARARARQKTNSELGLSPEEKMQLLRKRLQYEQEKSKSSKALSSVNVNECDLGARARKMSASKSVNDLAYCTGKQQHQRHQLQQQQQHQQQEMIIAKNTKPIDFTSDPNLVSSHENEMKAAKLTKSGRRQKDPERRKSIIQSLSSFFHKTQNSANNNNNNSSASRAQKDSVAGSAQTVAERPSTSSSGTTTISASSEPGGGSSGGMFSRFRISPRSKEKSKEKDALYTPVATSSSPPPLQDQRYNATKTINTDNSQHGRLYNHNKQNQNDATNASSLAFSSSSPQLNIQNKTNLYNPRDQTPPPIPPLPLNYQRSDDESCGNETREHKKQRAITKAARQAARQAELKRLRIAQEIQREQEEIEVQLRELEARGVFIEKALRGESKTFESLETSKDNDEKLLKELLEIWRNITQLKKRDEELTIRQQELQLEHRHAQLKEELNQRLSCNKLDKSTADVAAEGAILNEMLDIVAKRAALRPASSSSNSDLRIVGGLSNETGVTLTATTTQHINEESNV